jgi:hypothetical protein
MGKKEETRACLAFKSSKTINSILSQDVTVGLAMSQLLPLVDKPSFLLYNLMQVVGS